MHFSDRKDVTDLGTTSEDHRLESPQDGKLARIGGNLLVGVADETNENLL